MLARGQVGRLIRNSGLGVLDQAVVSAGSFLSSVMVARWSAAWEYGAYVVAFSVLMFFNAFQALLTVPLAVYGAGRLDADRRTYLGNTWLLSLGVFSACGVLVTCGGAAYCAVTTSVSAVGRTLLAAGLGVTAYLMQSLCRTMLYGRSRVGAALANDALVLAGHFATLVLLHACHRLAAWTAWLSIGVWWSAGALLGFLRLHGEMAFRRDRLKAVGWVNLDYGKWSFGTAMGTYVMTYLNVILLAVAAESRAAANLEAGRLIVHPLYILYAGLANYYIAEASRTLEASGTGPMHRVLRIPWSVFVGISLVYGVLVAWHSEFLLRMLYKDRYLGLSGVVRLWSLYYLVLAVSWLPVVGLWVMRRPRLNFLARAVSAGLTIVGALLVAGRFGAAGIVGVMAGGATLYAATTMVLYVRAKRRNVAMGLNLKPAAAATGE